VTDIVISTYKRYPKWVGGERKEKRSWGKKDQKKGLNLEQEKQRKVRTSFKKYYGNQNYQKIQNNIKNGERKKGGYKKKE